MKEIEALVEVFSKKEEVLNKLKKFKYLGIKEVKDIYFYDPLRKNLVLNKIGKLNECFRLRKKDNKCFVAYKLDHFDNSEKWIYSDEHETKIEDFECIKKIISLLGLKPLLEIINKKHTFIHENFEIVLEEVEELGLFLEVEYTSQIEEDINKIKKDILEFINNLGIETSSELNSGKLELMIKKKNILFK